MCVKLDCRRKGVGKCLVIECIEQARRWKSTNCILNVENDNKKAINFYNSLGFMPIPGRDLFGSVDMQLKLQ